MRGLNVCVLGPAALILTAIVIALTPIVGNAAEQDAAGAGTSAADVTIASGESLCQVSDAAVTWGIKESLRSYISGTIANGAWSVSNGATYETPNFGWSAGSGELDAGSGTLAFDGSLRFMGHDGILDTTLSGLELRFDGSTTAHLIFDVSGTTQDGTSVDKKSVEFADIDTSGLTITDGAVTLDAASVTLTEAGSAAFGTYPAGETFDPIAVSFSATSDCMPAPRAPTAALAQNVVIAVTVVAIAIGGLVYILRRHRRTKQHSGQN